MAVSPSMLLLAAGSGVATHLGFFHRGEHFLYPLRYVQAFIAAFVALTVVQLQLDDLTLASAVRASAIHAAVFLIGLYSSLVVYRLFFNPLNKIPGPYWARLTKLSHSVRNRNLDGHHVLLDLHRRYGKYVRVGPNDLSVTDADAVPQVHGNEAECSKSSWYDGDTPRLSMHTSRDKALHDRRRRIWSPAFSVKALNGYESRAQPYIETFLRRMDEFKGQPVEAQKWFNYLSFDIMGELAFGEGFGMLASNEEHWAIKLLCDSMMPMGFELPTWLFRTMTAVPGLAKDYFRFIDFCSEQLDKRIQKHGKSGKPDICHTLIDHYEQAPDKDVLLPMLQGDSRLIIVAGSDTTAATMSFLFYFLARLPDVQKALREEVRQLKTSDPIKDDMVKDSPLLNGAIKEALRLFPPVPSGVYRETPARGMRVNDTFVPGHTVIQMPSFVMARDEDNYVDPESFIPERWGAREAELIKKRDAFMPFSVGPFSCIGRNLAYQELRTVTAQVLDKFQVKFAPGEDGSNLVEKTTMHFTLGLAELRLCFDRLDDAKF